MDYQEVVAKLRSTKSRSKRELLDIAANYIEGLAEESFRLYQAERERSKGCTWCWHFQSDPRYLVSRGNGMYDEVIFKFCPVCGKKLEVEKK